MQNVQEELNWYKEAFERWMHRYYNMKILVEDMMSKEDYQIFKEILFKMEKKDGWF